MDVIVIGATGVLGPPVISRLVQNGHRVRALSRTRLAPPAPQVEPLRVDILDRDSVRDAVAGADAVVNLASVIPTVAHPTPDDWRANDLVRDQGTRTLVEAMTACKIRRLVQASVHLVFGVDRGGEVLTEASPVNPPPPLVSAVKAEELITDAAIHQPLAWTILRFGWLHGPRSWHSSALLARLRSGTITLPDGRPFWWSTISDQRAAQVAARAVTDANGWGIVHVADGPAQSVDTLLTEVAAHRSWPVPARSSQGDPDLRRSVRLDVSKLTELGIPPADPVSSLVATARSLDVDTA